MRDHTNDKLYPIGTEFMSNGKHPHKCTIVDILKTFNSKGELVDIRYVNTHNFLSGPITDYQANGVTIARGVARLNGVAA